MSAAAIDVVMRELQTELAIQAASHGTCHRK
jgi:hypothetical protein